MSLQVQGPASGVLQAQGARHIHQSKRKLFRTFFEIDSSGLDINARGLGGEVRGRALRLKRRWHIRGRKPRFHIPLAVCGSDQVQAWAAERKAIKLHASVKQSGPSQAGGQPFGAQEILLAEARVFGNGDGVRLELGAANQGKTEVGHFDGASETRREPGRERPAEPAASQRKRKRPTGEKDEDNRKG